MTAGSSMTKVTATLAFDQGQQRTTSRVRSRVRSSETHLKEQERHMMRVPRKRRWQALRGEVECEGGQVRPCRAL